MICRLPYECDPTLTSESSKESAAVIASRYRVGKMSLRNYVKYEIYSYLHRK